MALRSASRRPPPAFTLIELLVTDWYVTRHRREQALKNVIALGESKQQEQTALREGGTTKPS